jgi:hypothetical protein
VLIHLQQVSFFKWQESSSKSCLKLSRRKPRQIASSAKYNLLRKSLMRLERTLAFWTRKLLLAYLTSWLNSTTNLTRESSKTMSLQRIKLRLRMKMSNLTKMILKSSKKKTTTNLISSILLLRSLVSCSRLMVTCAETWLINLLMLSYLQNSLLSKSNIFFLASDWTKLVGDSEWINFVNWLCKDDFLFLTFGQINCIQVYKEIVFWDSFSGISLNDFIDNIFWNNFIRAFDWCVNIDTSKKKICFFLS